MENKRITWFETLTGIEEESPEYVREKLTLKDNVITSLENGQSFHCGTLEIPSLEYLIKSSKNPNNYNDELKVSELVGDVLNLHADVENKDALFQAASQFNLLEMVGPHITPEKGIGIYENDHTQGPTCAIACGAGTIYRNYLAPVKEQVGQSASNQIDCLSDIGAFFNNKELLLWEMNNGYALANKEGLKTISKIINRLTPEEYENLKGKLNIGIQWDTEVTISPEKHRVSQAYCSALPISYSHVATEYWSDFANLILEATYEATFYAALLNYEKTGVNKVFLTLVGGGAFGNQNSWIKNAILNSIDKFKNTPLDVKIVSYGGSDPIVRNLINEYNLTK